MRGTSPLHLQIEPHQFLVDKRGKPEAVILPMANYRKLMRTLEDFKDAITLKRAIRTSPGTLSHHQLLENLKK